MINSFASLSLLAWRLRCLQIRVLLLDFLLPLARFLSDKTFKYPICEKKKKMFIGFNSVESLIVGLWKCVATQKKVNQKQINWNKLSLMSCYCIHTHTFCLIRRSAFSPTNSTNRENNTTKPTLHNAELLLLAKQKTKIWNAS